MKIKAILRQMLIVTFFAGTITSQSNAADAGLDVRLGNEKSLKHAIAVNPQSADNWLRLGKYLFMKKRYGEAEWVLKKARNLRPNDQYTLWLSGVVAYSFEDYSTAKQFLKKVYYDFDYISPMIKKDILFSYLGKIYFEEGEGLLAAVFYSKAIEAEPNNWEYHFMHGTIEWFRGRGRYSSAFDAFKEAKRLRPRHPETLSMYAWLKAALLPDWSDEFAEKEYKEALVAVNKAIRVDRKNWENHELRGLIFGKQRRYEEAIAEMRRAISMEPNAAAPRFWLARMLFQQETETSKKEAEKQLVRAIAINPDFWVGKRDHPHVKLLTAYLLLEDRLSEADALIAWQENQLAKNQ